MRLADLQVWLRAEPFVPFTIRLRSGYTVAVTDPENVWIGRNSVLCFLDADVSEVEQSRLQMVSLNAIETIRRTLP